MLAALATSSSVSGGPPDPACGSPHNMHRSPEGRTARQSGLTQTPGCLNVQGTCGGRRRGGGRKNERRERGRHTVTKTKAMRTVVAGQNKNGLRPLAPAVRGATRRCYGRSVMPAGVMMPAGCCCACHLLRDASRAHLPKTLPLHAHQENPSHRSPHWQQRVHWRSLSHVATAHDM